MNKKLIAIIITVLAVAAIAGASLFNSSDKKDEMAHSDGASMQEEDNNPFTNPSADQSVDSVQTGEVKMDIADFAFTQKTLKVKKGTKVTWTNQDSARHDVMPDQESDGFMGSELLSKGESYSYTFDTPGSYEYHCTPHPYMKAKVEVVE